MTNKRLQNKVAESRIALPLTFIYTTLVWICGGLMESQMWLSFGCILISAYLMMVMNNSNALIRVYSRMVSCSFLILTVMCPFLFAMTRGAIVQLLLIAAYLILFTAYQEKESQAWSFYAFCCIGLASVFFIQILFFVPFIWILMKTNLMMMSHKTFWASILGLITPYWFVAVYYVLNGQTEILWTYLNHLTTFEPISQFHYLDLRVILSFSLIVLLALVGVIHYAMTSYQDKIKVRMIYGIFIVMNALSITFFVLQPQHYEILLRLIIVNTSPLIAHYIALTKTRFTNISFYIIVISIILLTAFNLWKDSLSF